jgi:uncharacterized membrane protein
MNNHFQNISNYMLPSLRKKLTARLLALALIVTLIVMSQLQTAGIPVASAQTPPTEIVGIITNGTEGGVVPENMEVLLMSIDLASNQIIEQESTNVDEDGIFRFTNLVAGPGLSYRIVANSGDYTPSIDLAGVENWSNVRIKIYDSTTSLEDINLDSYVLMVPSIDAKSRQAGVLMVINVNNAGDRIWMPNIDDPNLTGLDLLRFNLPEGFTDLAVESELPPGNILEIDTGFAMTNPIPPGVSAILVSYILSYEGDGFDFDLKLPYGADQVRMLLPDDAGVIEASQLGSLESVVVADNVFNSLEGNNFAVDELISVSFTGLPQPTVLQALSDFFDGRTYVIIIIWVVGIALLAILGYALYSSRKNSGLSSEDDDEFASRADIVAEIATLDEEFEADNIDEDDYNEQRDELKRIALEFDESSPTEDDNDDADEDEDDSTESEDESSEDPDELGK